MAHKHAQGQRLEADWRIVLSHWDKKSVALTNETWQPVEAFVIRFSDTFFSAFIMLNLWHIGTVGWDYMDIRNIIHLRMPEVLSSISLQRCR